MFLLIGRYSVLYILSLYLSQMEAVLNLEGLADGSLLGARAHCARRYALGVTNIYLHLAFVRLKHFEYLRYYNCQETQIMIYLLHKFISYIIILMYYLC